MKVGIIGLGVMGRNLALNARDGGCQVVATDSWETARNWTAPRRPGTTWSINKS